MFSLRRQHSFIRNYQRGRGTVSFKNIRASCCQWRNSHFSQSQAEIGTQYCVAANKLEEHDPGATAHMFQEVSNTPALYSGRIPLPPGWQITYESNCSILTTSTASDVATDFSNVSIRILWPGQLNVHIQREQGDGRRWDIGGIIVFCVRKWK